MAYLNALFLANAAKPSVFDPVAIGMREFRDYAAGARKTLIETYKQPIQMQSNRL